MTQNLVIFDPERSLRANDEPKGRKNLDLKKKNTIKSSKDSYSSRIF